MGLVITQILIPAITLHTKYRIRIQKVMFGGYLLPNEPSDDKAILLNHRLLFMA